MNSIERIFHPSRRIHSMAAALELALLALLAGWVLTTWRYPAGDFLNNAWAPARLLWLGGNSPYDQAAASQLLAGAATSPGAASRLDSSGPAALLAPVFPPARTGGEPVVPGPVCLAVDGGCPTEPVEGCRSSFAPCPDGAHALSPALNALMLGQVTAFAVVVLVAGALAADRGRVRLAGFLMAWALIKPQLTPLILLALGVWVWQGRRLRQLLIGGIVRSGHRPGAHHRAATDHRRRVRERTAHQPAMATCQPAGPRARSDRQGRCRIRNLAHPRHRRPVGDLPRLASTALPAGCRLDVGAHSIGHALRVELGSSAPAAADGARLPVDTGLAGRRLVDRPGPDRRWLPLDRAARAERQPLVHLGALRGDGFGLGDARWGLSPVVSESSTYGC